MLRNDLWLYQVVSVSEKVFRIIHALLDGKNGGSPFS